MENPTPFACRTEIGQNFLVDPKVVRDLVAAAAPDPDTVVLEVGPGKGILTEALLGSPCRKVFSLEIDRRLEPFLEPLFARYAPKGTLLWGDALRVTFPDLLPEIPHLVAANLPYHITTPLIWKFLEELTPRGTRTLVLMVQREAAWRLMAQEGSRDRTPLGITLQRMGTLRKVRAVSPGAFRPIPQVASTILEIRIQREPDLANDPSWRAFVRGSFAQRRKTLVNNWIAGWRLSREEAEGRLAPLALPRTARPEELTLPQWIRLAQEHDWRREGGPAPEGRSAERER